MRIITLLFLSALCLGASAQKLPNTQQVSLRAPVNVSIDGKATEWGAQYQAYNNATDLHYTIANDNENLYLVLRISKYFGIDNIIRHGVRFTINHSASKKDTSPVIITYPAIARTDRGQFFDLAATRINEGVQKPIDNSMEAFNRLLQSKSKFIRVEGIKEVTDWEIPIYNDKGIKAVSAYEKPYAYVYELAVPLKQLALNGTDTFSYQIKINFPDPKEKIPPSPPPSPGVLVLQPIPVSVAVTDFWGKYTLAK